MTPAEMFLWSRIRKKQVSDCWFYRQKTIGEYIADFYRPRAKLVIEVDGGHHQSKATREYDRVRKDFLYGLGIQVMRFTNQEVLTDINKVIKDIQEKLSSTILPCPPFTKGETGKGIDKIFLD